MVFAGHPQIVFNNLLVAGFYASFLTACIWLRATGNNRGAHQAIRFGGGMLSAVGLGLLLAMPQILPSVELNEVGPRREGMTVEDATEWDYHPKLLLAFVAPNVFGRPGEIVETTVRDPRTGKPVISPDGRFSRKLVGFDPGDVRTLYWEMTTYLGLLPLALALTAVALAYRRPEVWKLVAVLFGSILLALGKHGGLFQVVWDLVPGFHFFRFHNRFLLYAGLAIAILASLGFTWIVERIPWVRRREMAAAVIVTALCLLDLFNALGDHNPKVAADRWSSPPPVADRIIEHAGRNPAPFRITDTDYDRFVFVNAYFRARGWTGDLSPYDVARNMLHPNLNLLYGLTHQQIYFQLYPHWMLDASRLFYVRPRPDIAPEGGFKRIADLFNVRYVISPTGPAFAFDRRTGRRNPLDEAVKKLPVIATFPGDLIEPISWTEGARPQPSEFEIALYENRDAFPRAMLVPGSRVVPAPPSSPSLNQAQIELLSPGFDPRRELLIHPETGQPDVRETPPGEPIDAPVEFREYSPQRIRLVVAAPYRSWLFLSDTYYPGWKASIDGKPRPLYRANVCGRAVEVDAGRHVVTFNFAPSSFRKGCGLAVLGLLLLAGMSIHSRRVASLKR
jgi:hypothetical protein